jgi:hypothetical protein
MRFTGERHTQGNSTDEMRYHPEEDPLEGG